uniref:F-box domain-containing protein n=1 Tax=Heterorhabditis bacteriophora TaxID=37862 RepID=A0A1I7XG70_HETBA
MLFSWENIPYELLVQIFGYLPREDLISCARVCPLWNDVMRDDCLWKPHFEREFLWWNVKPKVRHTYLDEFLFFKQHTPQRTSLVVDDFGYKLHYCVFSPHGKYIAVLGEGANFCVYQWDPFEFLHERCLAETLSWIKADTAQFSPDENKLMISGVRIDGSGEIVVFSICPISLEVHFVSRTPSNPPEFSACWFDNNHIIVGGLYIFDTSWSPLASSVSHLWLSSIPTHKHDTSNALLCPFLRFLNKGGMVKCPLIANVASPRFRRVVQMTEQAQQEGKTLTDKLNELFMSADIPIEGGVKELKQILDMEQQCFRCYLKHKSRKDDSEKNTIPPCECICHLVNHNLLIYISGEFSERICFKLIPDELISEALSMKRFLNNTDSQGDEDDWSFVMRRVDHPDYHIDFGGCIDHISLSNDHNKIILYRQLFLSLETVEHNDRNVIRIHKVCSIDLEKMIVEPFPISGSMKPTGRSFVTSNQNFVASFSSREVFLWSRHHRGQTVRRLLLPDVISCIALHPWDSSILTVSDMQLRIFRKQ